MKKRKILIRFDDICPTMDYAQFEKACKILEKYNITPLLGVIPDCKDPELQINNEKEDFWSYIKNLQEKGYVIAMHGYTHVYDSHVRGIVNAGYKSEFAGHSFEVQNKKIKMGKQILEKEGIETNIFFAPSHSYDLNTLRALNENGFRYISDGMSTKLLKRKGIICVPCRTAGCPRIGKYGYYTAVFHAHEWVRLDKSYGYDDLKRMCEKYHNDIVNFWEYIEQPIGNVWVQRFEEFIYVRYIRDIKPTLSKLKRVMLKGRRKRIV